MQWSKLRNSVLNCSAALAVAVLSAGASVAQQPVVVTGEVRSERLNDQVVRVSGRLLVGLHLGRTGDLKFDKERLRATLSGQGPFCLQISSRDGRYRGLVEFRNPPTGAALSYLKFKSEFEKDLARFSQREVATRIVSTAACDDAATGALLPVVTGDEAGVLTALINPGDATVFARLIATDGSALGERRVRCARASEGVRTAFSHSCELTIPQGWVGGTAKLHLTIDEVGGSPRTEQISIILPRG
jgi:hypothetical protein